MVLGVSPSVLSSCLEILPGVHLDARLALWLASPRTLVVADLHWGYVESHRARGNLLPTWGDAEIAQRLDSLLADYSPREMIWLGDSLHTLQGRSSAEAFLARTSTRVTIVSGNHDARWNLAEGCQVVARDGFLFHHGDQPREVPADLIEVIGHHHPAASIHDGAGTRLKLPALIVSRTRMILPAFSPWAAGAPWPRTNSAETIFAIGKKRIFAVSPPLPHNARPLQ